MLENGSNAANAARSRSIAKRGHAGPGERRHLFGILSACVVLAASGQADAFDLSGGVSLGGIVIDAKPRLAVSPHAGALWRSEAGLLFAAQETCSILPATNQHGPGIYSQTSAGLGYGSENVFFSLGPAVSFYSVPACNLAINQCKRVDGLAAGGRAEVNVYFAGALGVAVSAEVDWVGGDSVILPGGVAAMLVAGPVLRWRSR